ncbi:hypothetical protein GN244_ATG02622 [Phytophthora infestans]|uniref:Bzip transcription factor n=1 Tax=Phytophthora infestans TaxID=4787 RepID=A0A833T7W1_PHYIN|nr:hypothetical protein GN244_ATG02622 [Phytophthora infestans]
MNSNDIEFLFSAMSPDILVDTSSGVDALLRKWNLLTHWFPDVSIQVKQLKQTAEHSIVALTTISFTITASAIRGAFPHLFEAREGSRCAQVAARLRDKHLVLTGSVRFDWDMKSKQVILLHHQVDMVSVLVRLLDDLEDVVLVFDGANITPECVVHDGTCSVQQHQLLKFTEIVVEENSYQVESATASAGATGGEKESATVKGQKEFATLSRVVADVKSVKKESKTESKTSKEAKSDATDKSKDK